MRYFLVSAQLALLWNYNSPQYALPAYLSLSVASPQSKYYYFITLICSKSLSTHAFNLSDDIPSSLLVLCSLRTCLSLLSLLSRFSQTIYSAVPSKSVQKTLVICWPSARLDSSILVIWYWDSYAHNLPQIRHTAMLLVIFFSSYSSLFGSHPNACVLVSSGCSFIITIYSYLASRGIHSYTLIELIWDQTCCVLMRFCNASTN